jgi:hypothetical protein
MFFMLYSFVPETDEHREQWVPARVSLGCENMAEYYLLVQVLIAQICSIPPGFARQESGRFG